MLRISSRGWRGQASQLPAASDSPVSMDLKAQRVAREAAKARYKGLFEEANALHNWP